MGFLDRFRKSEPEAPAAEEPKRERPAHGTVSVLWGPADRRPADQDELGELQKALSATADERIARYDPVLKGEHEVPVFGELSAAEAGAVKLVCDYEIAEGETPHEARSMLGMEKKGEWLRTVRSLEDRGYIRTEGPEERILRMKYSVLKADLDAHGISTTTDIPADRAREIVSKTDPALLERFLSSVPPAYVLTDKGEGFLSSNAFVGEYYSDDFCGLTVSQAYALKLSGEGSLYEQCQTMYRELTEAYWSKKDYKSYMEYSQSLAYLNLFRDPKASAYALAHLINANSLYKSGKNFWETPLKNVYRHTPLSVQDLVRYVQEEFSYGLYPKRTKVDKIPEVFAKYLQGVQKE